MSGNSGSLVVAFASRDGASLPKGHFGEARRFDLYRLTPGKADRIAAITNPQAETDHGDSGHRRKGAELARLLGREGVQVIVSRAFGPNIRQMRQRFLPVVVGCEDVTQAIGLLHAHWDQLRSQWFLGEGRRHLVLREGPKGGREGIEGGEG